MLENLEKKNLKKKKKKKILINIYIYNILYNKNTKIQY